MLYVVNKGAPGVDPEVSLTEEEVGGEPVHNHITGAQFSDPPVVQCVTR